MANPIILCDNLFDSASTITSNRTLGYGTTAELYDWRIGSTYRAESGSTSSGWTIELDMGSAVSADCIAIAGHNLSDGPATVQVEADTTPNPTTLRLVAQTPADNLPKMYTFTSVSYRYWKVSFRTTTHPTAFATEPYCAMICLGRRIEFEAGPRPSLDPYHRKTHARGLQNNNGTPLGAIVRAKTKRFNIDYGGDGDPGMTRDSFFAPSSGVSFDDDFIPHAIDNAKPFFFAWNLDVDADEVYLANVDNYELSMPFVGSTSRRGLQATFTGYREVS